MIDRGNYKLTRKYLGYRIEVDQVSKATANLERRWLNHLLDWADEKTFKSVTKIRPSFPKYAVSARVDGSGEPLSPAYIRKIVGVARRFIYWLSTNYPGYRSITTGWLDTLKPLRVKEEPKEHEAVTLEEMTAIANAPVETPRERRIRAAAVFWFLSGIRIGAFVTLPIMAVDLVNRTVKQWPKLGVKTKFGKHDTTHLLDLPDLLEVVKEWDQQVRASLPGTGLWFAHLSADTGKILPATETAGKHRDSRARKDLKEWLEKVGLLYHSPHKFRHGHAVYGLKQSQDMSDYRAVSQNLMHSGIKVTDSIYSILSNDDVGAKISNLGKNQKENPLSNSETLEQLADLVVDRLTSRVSGNKLP